MPIDRSICVANHPGIGGPYGYVPTLSAGIVFCVLYFLSMSAHTFVSIRHGVWWQLLFSIGTLCELLGWAGRTWSSGCPYQTTPFIMQITLLIIAPTFFTAGIYVILGRLIRSFGNQVSPLSPNMYLYIFCSADVASLIIQAVGGASASAAYSNNTNTKPGTRIMLAGIVVQFISLIIFVVLFSWVISRALKLKAYMMHARKVQLIVAGTCLSVAVVLIRSVYRTIELSQGWTGYLITRERFFLALDGAMMIIAAGIYNFIQPRWANIVDGKNTPSEETEMEETIQSMTDSGIGSRNELGNGSRKEEV